MKTLINLKTGNRINISMSGLPDYLRNTKVQG
jgi:hypothetical protein